MREALRGRLGRPRLWGAAAAALALTAVLAAALWRLGEDPGTLPPGSAAASPLGLTICAASIG